MIRKANYAVTVALSVAGLVLVGCVNGLPTSPAPSVAGRGGTGASDLKAASADHPARPIRGACDTVITPLDAANVGVCAAFEPVPSAFIAITGKCQLAHLGRVSLTAQQQVLFQLDGRGLPIIVNGQPVFSALRNCGVFTAANGDDLRHTTTGTVASGLEPGTVGFDGAITFTGGTGRFTTASGSASFSGDASLLTSTGAFTLEGAVEY